MRRFTVSEDYVVLYAKPTGFGKFMTTLTDERVYFGWTDMDSTHLDKNNSTSYCGVDNRFLSTERIQALSEKVKQWGYQLIYDDSNTCRWCIADVSGNILWRNYGLHKAIWRLEQQVKNQ